jgi:Putative lumazine-binding
MNASAEAIAEFSQAIQRYFNLMYDCDTSKFDQVFHPTAQLHGVRNGALTMWPAATYREVLAKREAPKRESRRVEPEKPVFDLILGA